MINKFIFLVFMLCISFVIPQYQAVADVLEKNYKWIKEPIYEFEDIDRFDIVDIPIKFGYTGNGLYGISVVKKDDKYNVIDYDGNLLFKDFVIEKPVILDRCEKGTFSNKWIKYNIYGDGALAYDMYGNYMHSFSIIPFEYERPFPIWNKDEQMLEYQRQVDTFEEITFEEMEKMQGNLYVVQGAKNFYSTWGGIHVIRENKFGVVKDKQIIINPKYDDMYKFHDNMAAVKLGKKWGFINDQGEEIIKPQYDSVGSFVCGYAPVELNGKFKYINKNGEDLTSLVFEEARPLDIQSGYAWVKRNGKWGIIQINGIQKNNSVLDIKNWKQIYKNYLLSADWIVKLTIDDFGFYDGIEFCILNMGENKVPALVIQNNSKKIPENEWCVYIIQYDGKKSTVKNLGTGYGKFYGYDEQNQLLKVTRPRTEKDFKIYALENNEWIQKAVENTIPNNSQLYAIYTDTVNSILKQ